jgi:hypothetical protein
MVILIFSSAFVAGALVLELEPVLEVVVEDGVFDLPQPVSTKAKTMTKTSMIGNTLRNLFILLPPLKYNYINRIPVMYIYIIIWRT